MTNPNTISADPQEPVSVTLSHREASHVIWALTVLDDERWFAGEDGDFHNAIVSKFQAPLSPNTTESEDTQAT